MINAETERTGTVRLDGEAYQVTYSLVGECKYFSAKLGGPPEDCYPDDSTSEVHEVLILAVFSESTGHEIIDSELSRRLLKEIEKLPIEDYLYESWSEAGGDRELYDDGEE